MESFRTAKGSRQRVVAYLGELEKSEKNGGAQLGRRLNKGPRPQPSLFDPPHDEEPTQGQRTLKTLENKGFRKHPTQKPPFRARFATENPSEIGVFRALALGADRRRAGSGQAR